MVTILFIDDDPQAHGILRTIVREDCELLSAMDGRSGVALARDRGPDLVLIDIGLPDIDGMTVLDEIVALADPPLVVMLTASAEPEHIVRAMKAGAHDYFVKPVSRGKIDAAVDMAIRRQLRKARSRAVEEESLTDIVGESRAANELRKLISRYARTDTTVLVTGESGTGKELAATAIHRLSLRCGGPFLAVNCGAIPDTLVESELFGSERGAFTDAVARPGLFERARGGTLLLDEVGNMSSNAQAKLLRVLESKTITRVGASHSVPIDIRIIAATNHDLKAAVRVGAFRQDLFYRLSILFINIPPLRERMDDLPLLCEHLLARAPKRVRLSAEALDKLFSHGWPGNVRELRNVLQRASVLCDGETIFASEIVFD